MRPILSTKLMQAVRAAVSDALHGGSTVNVPVVAERVRRQHIAENIALEDIVHAVVLQAQLQNVVIEFDTASLDSVHSEPQEVRIIARLAPGTA